MSGEAEVRAAMAALAAQGYASVPGEVQHGRQWLSVTWLSDGQDVFDDAGAIARTVLRVDPGAIKM